jgi:hypothetical protein
MLVYLVVQELKVKGLICSTISPVVIGSYRGGPGRNERVFVAMNEARYPRLGWLPSSQRSHRICNHLLCRHHVYLCNSTDVL